LTVRKVISYGLIAGLRYQDVLDMMPGEALDYFIYRRMYDDEQHRILRGE